MRPCEAYMVDELLPPISAVFGARYAHTEAALAADWFELPIAAI